MPQADGEFVAVEPAAVAAALAGAGVAVAVDAVEILPRDQRFAVRLPGERMAWFPTDAHGLQRLQRERRVLETIAAADAFAAPRILYEDAGGWDLRAMVAGPVDPTGLYERVIAEPAFARRLGGELGRLLARQHALPTARLAAVLPAKPDWPMAADEVRPGLAAVIADPPLERRAMAAIAAYEAAEAAVAERVLVHCDFGFHNQVIEPESGRVIGVFDYDGAALSDRTHDFKYLLFDAHDESLLDGALATYEPAAGVSLDRRRIRLMNAASAVTFLAFRAGSGPDQRPAGRTLAEDLAWSRLALERAGF